MPKLSIVRTKPFIVAACLFCCVWWLATISFCKEINDLKRADSTVTRHIQYSFTIQNKTNHLLEQADFWTYAPVKVTATQRCLQLEVSHPYRLIEDEFGNQVLHFHFKNLPPFSTKVITVKAALDLSKVAKPSSGDNLEPFLQSDELEEPALLEITKLARTFQAPTPAKTAEKTFAWVARNIEYTGYSVKGQGVLQTLHQKKGDCTEFADLFVALTRANDIPARGIAGYVLLENGILSPMEFHNWAEFYDGTNWNISDPQKKFFMQNQSQYIAMRIIGPSSMNPMGEFNRFRYEGEGLSVKMNL